MNSRMGKDEADAALTLLSGLKDTDTQLIFPTKGDGSKQIKGLLIHQHQVVAEINDEGVQDRVVCSKVFLTISECQRLRDNLLNLKFYNQDGTPRD